MFMRMAFAKRKEETLLPLQVYDSPRRPLFTHYDPRDRLRPPLWRRPSFP